MKKNKIGVLGTSDIAYRRMIPAIQKLDSLDFIGISVADESEYGSGSEQAYMMRKEKAIAQAKELRCEVYFSYHDMIEDPNIDTLYIPLPPALHFEWAKKALEKGKHVLLEKPFTTSQAETSTLLDIAKQNKLAVHENYAYCYHAQIAKIKKIMQSGVLGEIRALKIYFGFPLRQANDFRYNKALGGGALLDCGGYTIKLMSELLGADTTIVYCNLGNKKNFEVEMYGNILMENKQGMCGFIGFGMDNAYQCQLEIWGSKSILSAPRIFTAAPEFEAPIIQQNSTGEQTIIKRKDDQFMNSLDVFQKSISDDQLRYELYAQIQRQAKFIEICKQ